MTGVTDFREVGLPPICEQTRTGPSRIGLILGTNPAMIITVVFRSEIGPSRATKTENVRKES